MAGKLLVSLDFELFWGMLDVCPLEAYQDHVLGGRAAIPQLLELFGKYDIHATWAAVGFLFGEDRQELETLGHHFQGYSDTEVVLHSYAQWGAACLKRFNGIFAFGIWENRAQRLFLARDRKRCR